MTASRDTFRDFVSEQLGGDVVFRRMFGGYGLYLEGVFFGIVMKGRLFFKTSPRSRQEYVRRGMKPFRPNARITLKSYFEVPADILEDQAAIRAWALRAARP